ncbi:HD domain-containing protein [Marinomonas sp. M1K-6]|uniref:HD domain-containing protein n=1 Tax=Marinomonas profundi TaxID=2726122 RepID=A0A847R6G0_9GAMM|nr:HD domain-containing phosphohydrolase [Marinomonas profundi]NLQ17666.1 HD domain-containing protein [Marinomonas profundi]
MSQNQRISKRFSIKILVANMFLMAIVITAGIAISLHYNASKKMAVNHMLSSMSLLSDHMKDSVYTLENDARQTVELLAELINSDLSGASIERKSSLLAQFLIKRPELYSLYLGDKQEDFFQIINLDSAKDTRQQMNAREDDRWAVIDISGQGEKRLRHSYYYSATFRLNHQHAESSNFFPTERPWFAASMKNNLYKTVPYFFQHLQIPGQTYAQRIRNTEQVIGLDILLSSLSDQLSLSSSKRINGQEQTILMNQEGKIIASNMILYDSDRSTLLPSVEGYFGIPPKKLIDIANNPNAQQPVLIEQENAHRDYVFIAAIGNDILNQQYLAMILPEDALFQQATKEALHSALLSALVMTILLPIIWLFSAPIVRPIRQLQRETEKIKQRQFDDVSFTDSHIKEIWQLSNAFVTMSQDIKQHEVIQKEFMEALIRLIATAIDDKSAHTGGHCYRVPELGLMLSDALEKAQTGPYKDFQFANDNERLEFRIAAWLHDCGKITMPEHIIDKGSKLECLYNRIHEIRTRFEVLWRDAEIDYLHAIHTQQQDPATALATWQKRQTTLQEQFAFIAKANLGSEFMSEEDQQKVRDIGAQKWTRHFNNRLGLSPAEETMRIQQAQAGHLTNEETAPQGVTESLLSDKAEHIIPRFKEMTFNPSLGIKMDIPKHQYNQGEIYNLTIQKGTLTKEDRFKINEHIISTITMLESLPFPPELKRVPHYASTHHERMDGQGYPRKLNAEQLSIPDRVLMIADVFEALTASDRPYKTAKPVSVAIDIMYGMCQEGHLDLPLFRFFLESGIYLQYAEKFLPKSQIDEVNIKRYLTD